jgi:class 3 adenylate cyclase/tetratricopeptide (TPR) repeat protein
MTEVGRARTSERLRSELGQGGSLLETDEDITARLAPYLPRVALEWLAASPAEVHQHLDGTLLFVDVSGFTALTERLAARGKAGAEEITDVISSVFGELLGIAASYGADLWKWGGDAVLLYFSEPSSAERACRAAMLMSRAMGRIGRFKTSAGRVTLEVSIGAHSADFDLFLLGDRHRELIVTGPAATATASMETIAQAGEVVVSRDTARRLEDDLLGPQKLDGVLLSQAPEAEPTPPTAFPDRSGLDVGSLLPNDTRLRLLGGGEEAEHRQAAIAFVQFSGIDALTLESGPESVAACLGPLVSAAQEAAERHGVSFLSTDIGTDGGKIILVGGVPVHRGNDAERLLRAVRDVVAIHPLGSPVGLRAGVNAGRVFVFATEFALARRRIFSITGDAVNLAARVMGHAAPLQVLATEAVLVQARNPFYTEAVPPFTVKGKLEPVIASVVGAPRQALSDEVGDSLPFVGREAELEELLQRADAAGMGSGSVIEIVGAPGIGKSRLVSEALGRWALGTLRVACEQYGSATPYLPFRRVLRRLLGLADEASDATVASVLRTAVTEFTPELEPLLPLLADVVGVQVPSTREVDELEPRFRRGRLEHCVAQLLRSYLAAPSALVFEDAHAMDEASRSLLGRVSLDAGDLPLLVVLTRGPEGASVLPEGTARTWTLELAPLTGDAAARLAGGGPGRPLAAAQIAAIVERADGNPLFLRELLRTAGEAGGVEGLPESLEPLLAAEIDLLSPPDRQVLRAAAVLGTHFDPALLGELLDTAVSLDATVWTRLGAFVAPTPAGRRFAHGLMRDAAYEGLSFKRRRELHARAAQAIEGRTTVPDESAELLSLHWLHAEAYDRAWRYACLAGDRARALWANADAATFYARALQAAARLRTLARSEVLAVAEALGDAYELTGSYERSRQAYSEARRLCDGDVDRARLLRKIGVLHERQGRYREALNCYTRGRHLLGDGSRPAETERSELDLASAGIRSRQGHYRDCVRFATEASDEATRASHRSGLAHALLLRHVVSVYLGEPSDELARQALAIFEELGDLVGQGNVLNNLGIGAYYLGKWAEALEYYEGSREARIRSGDVIGAATEENNIAEILSDQGHLGDARSLFESARGTWLAAGYRVGAALATSNLGRLEARTGDASGGRRLLAEALEEFRTIRSPVFIAETQLRLAESEVLEGDFRSAIASLQELLLSIRGRSGLEQTEVATLRLLGTATALADVLEGRGSTVHTAGGPLEVAVHRSTSLEAPYELALALASRAALAKIAGGEPSGGEDEGRSERGEATAGEAATDQARAEEIFSSLGVTRALITWSVSVPGGPIFARTPVG